MNLSKINVKNISSNIYITNQNSFNNKKYIFNYKSYEKSMFLQNSLTSTITSDISIKIRDDKTKIT